ncbi:MAG: hypothetical protein EB120_14035 [Proteobacteria bacterium]|nr:hypothetical protein [Pseudomonadota bacterium]
MRKIIGLVLGCLSVISVANAQTVDTLESTHWNIYNFSGNASAANPNRVNYIRTVLQYVKPDICTYCTGLAASMGAVLLAAGTTGKRYALPHAQIMIHQPLGGAQGQATDIAIQAKQILFLKNRLNEILVHHTGQKLETIERDTDRDRYMTSEEAKTYGLVDNVIVRKETEKKS